MPNVFPRNREQPSETANKVKDLKLYFENLDNKEYSENYESLKNGHSENPRSFEDPKPNNENSATQM